MSIATLTAYMIITRHGPNSSIQTRRYFFCERGGYDPSNECSLPYGEILISHLMQTLSFVLAAMFPVVSLIYAVSIQAEGIVDAIFYKASHAA